jgi:flagellar protein FlaG
MEIRAHTSVAPPDKLASSAQDAGGAVRPDASPAPKVITAKQVAAAPTGEELATAVKNINRALQARSQGIEFSVDRDSARTVVKVVDTSTQEVIRQMPSQEALDIAKALDRMQSLLVKQQA